MPNEAPYGHGCPPEPVPENPVNIGRSAQKSAKQGDGPSARGTQSTNEGNSHRD
jgi:hypothetical protein